MSILTKFQIDMLEAIRLIYHNSDLRSEAIQLGKKHGISDHLIEVKEVNFKAVFDMYQGIGKYKEVV